MLDPVAILVNYGVTFDRMMRHWTSAKQGIRQTVGAAKFIGYSVGEDFADGLALRFSLFGATCYVAFMHDLKAGVLEYGVLNPLTGSEGHLRIPITHLDFDESGMVDGKWSMDEPSHVARAHMRLLAEHAGAFLAAYFGAYHAPPPK